MTFCERRCRESTTNRRARPRRAPAAGKICNRAGQLFPIAASLALLLGLSSGPPAASAGEPASCFASLEAAGAAPPDPSPRRPLSFALSFGADVSPYPLITTTLLPGAALELAVVLANRQPGAFAACAERGELAGLGPARWRYRAPESEGVATVGVVETSTGELARLRVLVATPYDGADRLEGYRIGAYPDRPLRGLDAYRRPPGLFRVDAGDLELQLSPHFRLGQLLSKQDGGFPRFVLVSARLLLKLERLLEALAAEGIEPSTVTVMSAFRTPWYNQEIGNRTGYSRHLFGDAADIYVDADGDGWMDDLNGDGAIDVDDAGVLAAHVERLRELAWYGPLVGGLGVYGPAPHRGPFIHIDTRGTLARWSSP